MKEEVVDCVFESIIDLGKMGSLRCYHFSDGRRMINADDIQKFFGFTSHEEMEAEFAKAKGWSLMSGEY